MIEYLWNVPPPIRALMVLAGVVLGFVLWALAAIILQRYIGWPKHHPFEMPR